MEKPKYSLAFMVNKLNELNKKEEELVKRVQVLYKIYEQIQEDKELLELMIMHQYNKSERMKE